MREDFTVESSFFICRYYIILCRVRAHFMGFLLVKLIPKKIRIFLSIKCIDKNMKIAYNDYATIISIIIKEFFQNYNFIIFYGQDIIKVDYIYLALYESCSQL